MKFLTCIFFSLLTVCAFGQSRDTILTDSSKHQMMIDAGLVKNGPLILIDDIIYKGLLKDIDPKIISSIDVLKGKDARQIYGDQAKNGAIIITTRNNGKIFPGNTPPVENEMPPPNPGKKLIVIDGIIYQGNFKDIDPENILSMDTLGNPGATNIYGEQGKNGVLLIMTLKFGIEYYQRKLSSFSMAYKIYMESNQNDDSGLVYLVNCVVLEGDKSELVRKIYSKVEKIKTVYFIDKYSEKLNLNNPKPMVVITTGK